jgi:hypothetical protein
MRTLVFAVAALGCLMISCSSEPKREVPETVTRAPAPKPADETRRFPKANLVNTTVIDTELMGKSFMPGGTLATYRKGKTEYTMFIAKLPSATDAAILLSDWRKVLTDAKLVPSFGGYFGQDGSEPLFVFTKGAWVAGIRGLPQAEADLQARTLAGQL